MVLLGVGFGYYPVAILGALFLIPAVLVPSKPRAPAPQPVPQQQRRETPSRPMHAARPAPPEMQVQAPEPMQPPQPAYSQPGAPVTPASPALFPTTMFPSMSQFAMPPQQVAQAKPEKEEPRDELVEIVAALAFLRFLAG